MCCIVPSYQRSQTAMHLAAELARTEVVEMLLKSGLDPTLRDRVRLLTNRLSKANIVKLPFMLLLYMCTLLSGLNLGQNHMVEPSKRHTKI